MEPRLVVEGLVSNQSGPYYVRLTKSTPGGLAPVVGSVNSLIDNAEPVDNATVIISDDFDQVDTLKYYQVDINDSEYVEYYNKGFYRTTWLKGISGRTYYLKIIDNDKICNSSAFMPSVPGIDSVGYLKNIVEKDGQE